MEFLFKAYTDQPSRLGIKYPYMYQAQKEYEVFFTKCAGGACTLKLEILQARLHVLLIAEQNGLKFNYKNLEYKTDTLRKLLIHINQKNHFEFVHVYVQENKPLVIKPYKKAQLIPISKIELIGSENFEHLY